MAKKPNSASSGVSDASKKGIKPAGNILDLREAGLPSVVVQKAVLEQANRGWLSELEVALELQDENLTGPPDKAVVKAFQSLAYLLWGHLHSGQQISIEERVLVGGAKHRHATAIASHPSTPGRLLEALAKNKDTYVRRAVAENPSTPVRLLEVLAKDKDSEVRRYVAENPSTPVRLLESLAKDKRYDIRGAVAENPSTPVRLLEALAKDKDTFVRMSLPENPKTPVRVLEVLAKDKDSDVRRYVAKNLKMTVRLLEALAKDEDAYVRMSVAQHTSTPRRLLETLAKDEDREVRNSVASHPSTPPSVLEFLALEPEENSENRSNIEAVWTNPAGSAALRTEFQKQLSVGLKPSHLRVFGLMLKDCPPAVLTKCAKSSLWLERCAVAQHAMPTKKLVESLVHDTHTAVRAAARWRLAQGGGETGPSLDKAAKAGAKRKADYSSHSMDLAAYSSQKILLLVKPKPRH